MYLLTSQTKDISLQTNKMFHHTLTNKIIWWIRNKRYLPTQNWISRLSRLEGIAANCIFQTPQFTRVPQEMNFHSGRFELLKKVDVMAACTINRSIIFARNAGKGPRTQPFDFFAPPLFAKRKNKKWRSHSGWRIALLTHVSACKTSIQIAFFGGSMFSQSYSQSPWRGARGRRGCLLSYAATPGEVMGVQRGCVCESCVERVKESEGINPPVSLQYLESAVSDSTTSPVMLLPLCRMTDGKVRGWVRLLLRTALRASHSGSERVRAAVSRALLAVKVSYGIWTIMSCIISLTTWWQSAPREDDLVLVSFYASKILLCKNKFKSILNLF